MFQERTSFFFSRKQREETSSFSLEVVVITGRLGTTTPLLADMKWIHLTVAELRNSEGTEPRP